MVDINKLQGTRGLIHVIKRVEIYLMRHKTGNSKINDIAGNLLCKN